MLAASLQSEKSGSSDSLSCECRVGNQARQSADLRLLQSVVGRREGADHGNGEEQQIGHDDAPEPRRRRVDDGHRAGNEDGRVFVDAEKNTGDLDRRQSHGGHDHDVEENAEIKRPKPRRKAAGLPEYRSS